MHLGSCCSLSQVNIIPNLRVCTFAHHSRPSKLHKIHEFSVLDDRDKPLLPKNCPMMLLMGFSCLVSETIIQQRQIVP